MNCPICGHGEHRVITTATRNARVRRLRECGKCAHRWHTVEAPEVDYRLSAEIVEAFKAMKRVIPGE